MIGSFWTRGAARKGSVAAVSYGQDIVEGRRAFAVNWSRVGDQLVLIDRSDLGAGFFNIEMNYSILARPAGDAGGRGGARAGFTNGTGVAGTWLELPGLGIAGVGADRGTRAVGGHGLLAGTIALRSMRTGLHSPRAGWRGSGEVRRNSVGNARPTQVW